ncbi:MerR family transcriptional regulator [Kitasatospora cheerisanensis]|uniref:MerR family transcriptional regulator n=1 Tax=Kitasatospora cheerisanensis TaxID=81942 RepID=UPI00055DBDBC|nr:MerR family transcriptional regulator [Kitasatospora cheerisanensis]
MAWPIAEVARMSGVTARTLRHYSEIGLLRPAWIGANGHRHYAEDELLRLRQILVLRELGLGLREIGEILSSQADRLEALRQLTPMAAADFTATGAACVANEQWRAAYERIAAGLAAYQRDAITAYAEIRLP